MKTWKKTGAVAALGASLLLPAVSASPASAAPSGDPGRIYVGFGKNAPLESIGSAAKIASEFCNRPMTDMIRLAREVDDSGQTVIVCRAGNAAPVDLFFSDAPL
ncbi:hypothetical protein QFZ79_000128 [Arthrobacter sp. V4I6]|uniref:hypothetical protein n=1 Tax=unclassified Arthrobacter TaxID=235627 RepID=UPI002788FB31|nr:MULTISPECIES: hypothetical protein [unclassified Arthrobacter]MDQ0822390.1 hypothetical protein [Arthrobacter sp. V1I7]MDQ0852017.1 hypothetical protein [Arthrobacter sp. V4I6]